MSTPGENRVERSIGGYYQPLNPPPPVPAPPLPDELDPQHEHDWDDQDWDDDWDEFDPDDTNPGLQRYRDELDHESGSSVVWSANGIGTESSVNGLGTNGGANGGTNGVGTESGAGGASIGGPGRHARRANQPPPDIPLPKAPRLDYIPRHAAPPDVEPVSATDLTEILARVREDPTEAPRLDRPESARARPVAADPPRERIEAAGSAGDPDPPPGKRVRVVLSQRRGQAARPVRTVVDVQELTQVGEVLRQSLIRSQLGLALRIAAIALLGLGTLPAMFYYVPRLNSIELFGVRLPWLLLGVGAYPFLLALGWMYVRAADKLEQIFADHIQS
ncbi:MAG TPA: hypothetical protein VGH89_04795 [Pseudonocardia sp.]|jgi:hypothetical protein